MEVLLSFSAILAVIFGALLLLPDGPNFDIQIQYLFRNPLTTALYLVVRMVYIDIDAQAPSSNKKAGLGWGAW